ncbi:hypothetical protein F5984_24560 [Rudanella paleaurantiibacter]|uniref:histidine kinase n=1 Tax=Rudanella paleaurantiibacter TaxID=2614655 RepID=A0A7J5TSM2_9BACT|nr:HAMP domain-containing sensor histidine kinase [Rudanella paleaurantiibacter]KAB7726491.1 hypothetical protein F5984_24560 [Rudanella paleaurantiibacter]
MRLILPFILVWLPFLSQAQATNSSPIVKWKHDMATAAHDSIRLRVCTQIVRQYQIENQYDSLYRYVQRGLGFHKASPSDFYVCELYYYLGRYYRHKGLYRRGIGPLQQAISHADRAGSEAKSARYQYVLAVIFSDAGQLEKAVEQIGSNLKYLLTHQNEPMLAANYLLIIELYGNMGNTSLQAQYQQKYLSLVKDSWPPDHRMYAHIMKGQILEKKNRWQGAANEYRAGLRCAQRTGDSLKVIEMLHYLGVNGRHRRQYLSALSLFNNMEVMARRLHDLSFQATAKREQAITYLLMQQPKTALQKARQAANYSRQNKQEEELIITLQTLVTALEANGEFRNALIVSREAQQIKDRRFAEQSAQKVAQMQAEFDSETSEHTIRVLQKNAQIAQLQASRQQQQIQLAQRTQLAAAVVIGLLGLLCGVVIYFLRKTQRTNIQLNEHQQLLQQTADALAESNATKDKLFSLISHDLRSPVASMKNSIRQLRSSDTEFHLKPLMNRLDQQVDSVLDLLTNLLDWSMVQLKGFQLNFESLVLQELVAEVLSQTSELIQQKQLTVINQVDKHQLVVADRHQLMAVIRNVLTNAIKFTPTDGFIRLHTVAKSAMVELHIRDTGVGMTAEQISNLFKSPDVRSGTSGEKGVGLGLRICREMMDRQGGTLWVEQLPKSGTLVRIGIATPVQTAHNSVANDHVPSSAAF